MLALENRAFKNTLIMLLQESLSDATWG